MVLSSLSQLQALNFYKELKIEFIGDKVNDAGGLLREWMHLVVKELFERGEFCIFEKADTDELCFRVNADDEIDQEFSTELFCFLGVVFGKALFERMTLDCYLDRTFLRLVLGQVISLADMHSYDKQLYKSWKFLLECSGEELAGLEMDCSLLKKAAGQHRRVVLLKDEEGEPLPLTVSSRVQFVEKCIEHLTYDVVRPQVEAFKRGLHRVVPLPLLPSSSPRSSR